MPAIACNEPARLIEPTQLAPQDLSGLDFSHKDLWGEDFSGKNMQGVKLINSDLSDAVFIDTDLRNADFTDAEGEDISFVRADLRGATLNNFCFRNSTWIDAKLDERWAKIVALLSEDFYPGQDLSGYDLSNVCLRDKDLSNVNLEGADLRNSNLTWTRFIGANLRNANLEGADLWTANLTNADLTGAKGVKLYRAFVLESIAIICDTRMPNGEFSDDSIENCSRGITPVP